MYTEGVKQWRAAGAGLPDNGTEAPQLDKESLSLNFMFLMDVRGHIAEKCCHVKKPGRYAGLEFNNASLFYWFIKGIVHPSLRFHPPTTRHVDGSSDNVFQST